MTVDLIDDSETRHKKGNYSGIKCRLCGSYTTRTQSDSNPIWIDDKDATGDLTGSYICYDCYYNKDKVCYRCGGGKIFESIRMIKHYNSNKLWTGEYVCISCHNKDQKSYKNRNISLIIKEGGGSVMDVVVATVLEIQTCSIYVGDKKLPFGLIHEDYGIIGVKTSSLKNNKWYFNINDYVSADTYFLLGLDEGLENIEAVYVIPAEERMKDNGRLKSGRLSITKNSNKYKKFEDDPEQYNTVYQNMNIENISS